MVVKVHRSIAAAVVLVALAPTNGFAGPAGPKYSPSMNYTLHCQGCHKSDGAGQPGFVPPLQGSVAKFLAVPAGRAYLVRVPGTAQSLLNDREAAEVLNWIVQTFDAEHLPADFVPYEEQEIAELRRSPISQSSVERARVLALMEASAAMAPPEAFAICAACHPISPAGEHAQGPNLRGAIGRRAGSAPGYGFSRAMRESGIVWSKSELDDFLRDAAAKIPGTMMGFNAVSDAAARRAVIDYLDTVR